jgi:PAS domain S-box-containing protein
VEDVIEMARSSSDAIVVTMATPPHQVLYANSAWEALCGYTLEEVKGQTCKFLQGHMTCAQTVKELNALIAARHQPIRVRLLNYRKNGTAFVNDLSVEILTSRGQNGAATHLCGTLQRRTHADERELQAPILPSDDTDYERTMRMKLQQPRTIEEALLQTENPQVITEACRPYRILAVNQAWCDACGYTSEEAVGQTCRMLQGPGSCRKTLEAVAAAAEVRTELACKVLNYTKDGRPFLNLLLLSPISDHSNQAAQQPL